MGHGNIRKRISPNLSKHSPENDAAEKVTNSAANLARNPLTLTP